MATLECGHESFGAGYGTIDGKRHCYECCARIERESMIRTGKATLYLTFEGSQPVVTDWPGKLRFYVSANAIRKGRHNIAGTRTDVSFVGPDRHWWHGTQYGRDSQIIHCKRTKERVKVSA